MPTLADTVCMNANTTIGCRACHELPANEWCDFHERTLRPVVDPTPLTRTPEGTLVLADPPYSNVTCSWFALCEDDATTIVQHPILGGVPCCARCAKRATA